jgi:serine/threonine-protein kinase
MAEGQDGVLAIGKRVGDYVVEGTLGGGGMARVYRARHAILDTVHALKVLSPQYRVIPEARQRFLDEAKIQAKHLDHPHIVKVTNIVATEEVAALVMELVDGPTLEEHIASMQAPPSIDDVRALMLPIL